MYTCDTICQPRTTGMDLSKYYIEICKEPILTKIEEVSLFKKYRDKNTTEADKDTIRSRIVRANLRFAFKQAKKYSKNDPGIFADLISAGNEGLLVGFEKFNSTRDIRFLSYAGWWVQQRILKEMSKMRIVALPIWKQQLAARIQKAKDINEKITLTELYEMFPEISKKDINELWQTKYLTFYIDDMDENEFEIDVIGEGVQRKMDEEKIWKAVSSLPSPHREIVARSFGFEDGEVQTPAQMARALKVSKEEVRRVLLEGMKILKETLGKKEAYLDK